MDLATPYDRFREFLDRVAALGDDPDDDVDLRLRKHAFALTGIFLIPASLLWAVIGVIIDRSLLTLGSVYFAVIVAVMLLLMAQTRAFLSLVRALLVVGMAYVVLGHVALGGLVAGGASLVWGLVAPVSAVLYFDRDSGLRWFAGYAAMAIVAIVADPLVATMVPASWAIAPPAIFAYNLLGPGLIVLLLIRYVDGQRLDAQMESRRLLNDMLPRKIADRLSNGERLIAEHHAEVTVLFADVVDFTGLAEKLSPRDLLLVLNQMFSIFDRLAVRHGLEKIKTMGDAYIAVAGAPQARADHADAAMRMAMDMHRDVARLGGLRKHGIRLRIGLASGPVTAGVIGQARYAYDLWGDTVNIASRMESYGVAGMVQAHNSTRDLVRTPYPWQRRVVDVKGKGAVVTYLVEPAREPVTARSEDRHGAPAPAAPQASPATRDPEPAFAR